MHVSDPDGVNLRTEPVFIEAGPHRVAAAFIRTFEGPSQDLMSPHDWSIASTSITDAYGFTTLPHLRDLAVTGPFEPAGMSSTPSRQRVFSCRPAAPEEESSCAEAILSRLGTRAYRRPLTEDNLAAIMALYRAGAEAGGFEEGVRLALEGVLASPHFVFRFEERPAADADGVYALSDYDLASRLSFFLWATGPDDELLEVAGAGRLSDPGMLEAQVRRMLADPRAEALATRFRGTVVPPPGSRGDAPGRPPLPGLRPAAQGGDAPRDRVALPHVGAGGPQPVRVADGRLHLRERAAGAALRDPGRDGNRVPQGSISPSPSAAASSGTGACSR